MSEKIEPITREEKFLSSLVKGGAGSLNPITREEMYLAKAAGMNVRTPEPITRREILLDAIAKSEGGGGENGGVSLDSVAVYIGDYYADELVIVTGVLDKYERIIVT